MLYLFIILFIIIIVVFAKFLKPAAKPLKALPIPNNIGLVQPLAQPLVHQVESSFTESDKRQLKNRVLKEHPKWKDHEFDWLFMELKRYFFLCSLLKSVPMYSSKVDELWHEMILFTQKYADFCKQLFGQYLHHTPHTGGGNPSPHNERAFFDLLYLSYFQPSENSVKIWGSFMRKPLHPQILADFTALSEKELLMTYFRTHSKWKNIQLEMIQSIKKNIKSATELHEKNKAQNENLKPKPEFSHQSILFICIYFSMFEYDNFEEAVSIYLPDVLAKNSFTFSSCSGFACASDVSSKSDDSSSSSGDSGASCGSGCGSS
ncbi:MULTISPECIES: glycine-rich domain-containing protein [Cytobacillus]|uniref:Uncharacterized protein n=1 Tax=Cytobacillus stercorigallinarum TaxID=2762240 RepID=A0ABR8QQ86_9BACI|nr:hypothetical protein [Cytobacillus stercorigallinarum]MBD7937711.1 hypothetical protein [Cytobacillus stercorigallinarum]